VATYKYGGIKPDGDSRKGIVSSRLILEGPSSDPKRSVELGGEVELSDEEYEGLKSRYKFTKVGDSDGDNGSADDKDKAGEGSGAQHASAGAEAGTAGRKSPQAKS